ncbi:hypothetical protein TRICI_005743 [Trichomonascus ciferrii]|uniref:Zinc finger C2H2 LYAR-type domain-containing protein n=1 Tax=Trichomonascus ciferrii TaxID=44093 RepID=A0A642UPT7_9ASCO|nr:hypothetical protein TRICI_005743 [Trichomonascus ciferrii]
MGHFNKCRDAYFTCIDCSTTFEGDEFKNHTSCITEKEKYEKGYGKKQQKNKQPQPQPVPQPAPEPDHKAEVNGGSKKKEKHKKADTKELVPSGKAVEFSKVLKALKKKHNQKRKQILKNIKVENCNGELVLKLADL